MDEQKLLQNIKSIFDNKFDKIDKRFDKIDKKFDKLSNSLGFETESRANAFLNKEIECRHKIGKELFDYSTGSYTIWDNNKNKIKTEIDNILVNGKNIGIVETKTLLEPHKVKTFLSKNLKHFLALPPIRKKGKTITIKDKTYILFFMCRFITNEDYIKEMLKKSGKEFYIYQEEPYREFKII